MLVRNLPRMVRYLKDRGAYVLFNTNGTLLTEKKGRELTEAGLDELRVSLDAADRAGFKVVRGKDYFDRIVRNVRAFTERQRAAGKTRPRVSLWLTGLKETIDQLDAFVRLAHDLGVAEVYLQRLVYFPHAEHGLARESSALFERLSGADSQRIEQAKALADTLGIRFDASGATEPGTSLKHTDAQTYAHCRRPWTVMYFTAHGRALPCCIAPFSQPGYEHYTLGDATVQTLREIWNGPAYRGFREALLSDRPPSTCANCGLRWSL
jgi:MoaA/NifB/PqqE/SkfB family radical SAM enzyme